MSDVPVFYAFVSEDGVLTMDHRVQFKAYYRRKFKGCEVAITIEDKAIAKTRLQEKGFHSCLKPWVAEGHRIDDLKHFLLKEIFGTRESVNPITGEVVIVLAEPHTSKLSKAQYSELIERTLEIAAGCGVILEAPSEYKARKKAEQQRATRAGRKKIA